MTTYYEKIKSLTIDEMTELFVTIEEFYDTTGINKDEILQWLKKEV